MSWRTDVVKPSSKPLTQAPSISTRYGQTGAGKTYTLYGNPEQAGLSWFLQASKAGKGLLTYLSHDLSVSISMLISISIPISIYLYLYYLCPHIYICIHIPIHTYMHIHICVSIYIWTYTSASTSILISTSATYTYTYIHSRYAPTSMFISIVVLSTSIAISVSLFTIIYSIYVFVRPSIYPSVRDELFATSVIYIHIPIMPPSAKPTATSVFDNANKLCNLSGVLCCNLHFVSSLIPDLF